MTLRTCGPGGGPGQVTGGTDFLAAAKGCLAMLAVHLNTKACLLV